MIRLGGVLEVNAVFKMLGFKKKGFKPMSDSKGYILFITEKKKTTTENKIFSLRKTFFSRTFRFKIIKL